MARLTFPNAEDRLVYTIAGASDFRPKIGALVRIYTDAGATTLADIQTLAGAAITNSELTVDANSLLPRFLGTNDGADTLYAKGVGGTTVSIIHADVDSRLDALGASVISSLLTTSNVFTKSQAIAIVPNNPATVQAVGGNNGPFNLASDSAGTTPSPFMNFFSMNASLTGKRVEFTGRSAFPSDYPAFAFAPFQFDVFYGTDHPGQDVVQTTQGGFLYTKYQGPTRDDSAEGWSSVLIMSSAAGFPYTQTQAVAAFEADSIIQSGVTVTGKVVGYAGMSGPQTGGICSGVVARYHGANLTSFGQIANPGMFAHTYEDPTSGSITPTNCYDVYSTYYQKRVQTRDKFWAGTELTRSALTSAAIIGDTVLNVTAGTGSNFTVGQSLRLGWGTNEEILFITAKTANTITVGALANAHSIGEIVVDTSGMANMYYSSGALKTDMGLIVRQSALIASISLTNSLGSGFVQFPNQSPTPGTPTAGQTRFYFRSGVPYFKSSDGVEHAISYV